MHADVNGGRFSDTVGSDDRLDEEVASCSDLRLLVAGRAVGDGRDFDELDALWIERFSSGILEMRANLQITPSVNVAITDGRCLRRSQQMRR